MRRLEEWATRVETLLTKREHVWSRGTGKIPMHLEKEAKARRVAVARAKESQGNWIQGIAAHGVPHVRLVAVFTGE